MRPCLYLCSASVLPRWPCVWPCTWSPSLESWSHWDTGSTASPTLATFFIGQGTGYMWGWMMTRGKITDWWVDMSCRDCFHIFRAYGWLCVGMSLASGDASWSRIHLIRFLSDGVCTSHLLVCRRTFGSEVHKHSGKTFSPFAWRDVGKSREYKGIAQIGCFFLFTLKCTLLKTNMSPVIEFLHTVDQIILNKAVQNSFKSHLFSTQHLSNRRTLSETENLSLIDKGSHYHTVPSIIGSPI